MKLKLSKIKINVYFYYTGSILSEVSEISEVSEANDDIISIPESFQSNESTKTVNSWEANHKIRLNIGAEFSKIVPPPPPPPPTAAPKTPQDENKMGSIKSTKSIQSISEGIINIIFLKLVNVLISKFIQFIKCISVVKYFMNSF